MLSVLPVGMSWMELDVFPCAGPLLPALARSEHLQELFISSNAVDVSWDVCPTAALSALRTIGLDYRRRDLEIEVLPRGTQRALSAAAGLHSLELRVVWTDEVAQLCIALSGLRQLG